MTGIWICKIHNTIILSRIQEIDYFDYICRGGSRRGLRGLKPTLSLLEFTWQYVEDYNEL